MPPTPPGTPCKPVSGSGSTTAILTTSLRSPSERRTDQLTILSRRSPPPTTAGRFFKSVVTESVVNTFDPSSFDSDADTDGPPSESSRPLPTLLTASSAATVSLPSVDSAKALPTLPPSLAAAAAAPPTTPRSSSVNIRNKRIIIDKPTSLSSRRVKSDAHFCLFRPTTTTPTHHDPVATPRVSGRSSRSLLSTVILTDRHHLPDCSVHPTLSIISSSSSSSSATSSPSITDDDDDSGGSTIMSDLASLAEKLSQRRRLLSHASQHHDDDAWLHTSDLSQSAVPLFVEQPGSAPRRALVDGRVRRVRLHTLDEHEQDPLPGVHGRVHSHQHTCCRASVSHFMMSMLSASLSVAGRLPDLCCCWKRRRRRSFSTTDTISSSQFN